MALRSGAACSATRLAVSTITSSITSRTLGLISSSNTCSAKKPARPVTTKKAKSRRRPRCISAPRSAARREFQRVAHPAMRRDRLELGPDGAQLGAQRLDMGVDGAVGGFAVGAPDLVQQRIARADA